MASNTIKLSLGSILLCLFFACTIEPRSNKSVFQKKNVTDTCGYSKYNARQIMTGLGCDNCHTKLGSAKFRDIPTFSDISTFDSLKMIDFAFIKRHNGWYNKNLKASRMDTLTNCEIKSVIRYIKDFGRDVPLPNQ